MKIALVAPSPVPFVIGGAENLALAWQAALNAQPGILAELIKLPSPERTFWELVDSYRRFAELDLGHFDRVISAKYPAWMVAHPDHHLFMLHKLRGLYDTWPLELSTEIPGDAPALNPLVQALERAHGDREALPEIFGALVELRDQAPDLPAEWFALPGALIRQTVHILDAIGLGRGAIRRHAVISRTVATRADHFPIGVDLERDLEVIHPPTLPRPHRQACARVPAGAILTVSRLDRPKRIDWIIAAYQQAALTPPLVIVGEGGHEPELRAAAANQPHIHFLGRISDAELADAYAQALFVCFVPDHEDYGLVALEALQAGKPVLTCRDAGGVTELVRDGVNGRIVAASIPALAAGMRELTQDVALRSALAERAPATVAHLTWPAFVRRFTRRWPRLAVINTFAIHPPVNGGQLRMFHLYRELARMAEIRLVNLSSSDDRAQIRQLAPGLHEQRVPMAAAHHAFRKTLEEELRAPCDDVAAMLRPELSPTWLEAIDAAARWADAVILCHPYGWPAVRAVSAGPVIYEALNVEADLKQGIFGHAAERLAAVRQAEGDCARAAVLVTACSPEDASRLQAYYDLPRAPLVVPNGVAATAYHRLDPQVRRAVRHRLGLTDTAAVALFVGSWHGPNIAAVQRLHALALRAPNVHFVVVGSVCQAPGIPAPLENLRYEGRVSAAVLHDWLAAADIGINPVETGSGTNLKLLEYAAAELPILSTAFGARGGILEAGTHYVQAALDDFPRAILATLAPPERAAREARVARARERAVTAGDWRAIARHYFSAIAERVLAGDV